MPEAAPAASTGTTSATETPPAALGSTPPPAEAPVALGAAPASSQANPPPASDAGAAAVPPAPKPLEVKLPEGVDSKEWDWYGPTVQAELGIQDSAKAQKFLDTALAKLTAAQKARAEAQAAERAQREQAYDAAIRMDPEVGAGKPEVLQASMRAADRAINKFGGKQLLEKLKAAGLAGDPDVVRTFVRIGKAAGEDSIAGSAPGGGLTPEQSQEQLLRSWYPSMFKNKE